MDYEEFKKEVLKITNIYLSAYKEKQMRRRIDAFMKKYRCADYREFITLLMQEHNILETFKAYLTINVTQLFRNPSQWNILEEKILPLLSNKNHPLKIWSAACSKGDEAYSLAMLLSEHISFQSFEILATDIDQEILARAHEGIYTQKELETIPEKFRIKYFSSVKEGYQIKDDIKRKVIFKQHDLIRDVYPQDIDLIVCRNVFIYFTERAKQQIYHQMNRALREKGILFVGSTEQIISSQQFGFQAIEVFFYQKIGK